MNKSSYMNRLSYMNELSPWINYNCYHINMPLLIVKLAEECHSPRDPVLFRFVTWNLHSDDEVGRVTSGRQNSASLACLVHWGRVCLRLWEIDSLARLYPNLEAVRKKKRQKFWNKSFETFPSINFFVIWLFYVILTWCLKCGFGWI